MQVELMIYLYLALGLAMIGFNLVCAFYFKHQDKRMVATSKTFERIVKGQLTRTPVSQWHKRYLSRKLRHTRYLMAYDVMLSELHEQDAQMTERYLKDVSSVFTYLSKVYGRRDKMQAAYFPYIIKKYALFLGECPRAVFDMLISLVNTKNLYCRENALEALYSIGNCKEVVKALCILNNSEAYQNPAVMADGLLSFTGDHKQLQRELFQRLLKFRPEIRTAILDYFLEKTDQWQKQMLELMNSKAEDVVLGCVRYLGRYPYRPAEPALLALAENEESVQGELETEICAALSAYPSQKTINVLLKKLHRKSWQVCVQAAQSLESMGLGYMELVDEIDGPDRQAGEILQYLLERKKREERGA